MKGPAHDEEDVLRGLAESGARALVIGRRALVMLGAPLVTGDTDVWLHIDDIERLNDAMDSLELQANKTPAEARATGRYLFENDVRLDVLVRRSFSTASGTSLAFDDAWARRQILDLGTYRLALPSFDDLITTKRWSSRPKDMPDIQWLELRKQTP